MSSNWPKVRLGDYCTKVGSGATPRGGTKVYLDDGPFSLIRSQNIYNDGFKEGGLTFIDEEAADKLKNVSVETNDVLLNITGDSVARVCLAPEQYMPARVNQHVAIIRPALGEFDPRFLRYYLVTPAMQSYLLALAGSGATRNALTKGMIEGFEIPKPDIDIQRSIADVLSALDNKIELNRQINQSLEQIAQAIFKSWFVDFEPVKAKIEAKQNGQDPERAAMRTISGLTDEQLEQLDNDKLKQLTTSAAHFPDELEESELGEIPKGWAAFRLIELVKQIKPGTNYQPKRQETGIPFVNGRHVQNGFLDFSKDIKYITVEEYRRVHKSWKPEINDVLITRIGTLGRVAVIIEHDLPMALHYNSIDIKENILNHQFLYFLLKSDKFQKEYHLNKKQAVQEFVTIESVENIEVIIPKDYKLLDKLAHVFESLFLELKSNYIQNKNLTEIRDALLPKLLSGKITIGKAEQKREAMANCV